MSLAEDFERNALCEPHHTIVVEKTPMPPSACPKCKGKETKIIGQSQKPMLTYAQCDTCGHVFVPDEKR